MAAPPFDASLVDQVTRCFPSGLFSVANTYNKDMIVYEAAIVDKRCSVRMYQTNLETLASQKKFIDEDHALRTLFQLDLVRKVVGKKEYIMTMGNIDYIKGLSERRIHIMVRDRTKKIIAATTINGKDCVLNYIKVHTEDLSAWSTIAGLVGALPPIKAVYIYGTHRKSGSKECEKIVCSITTTSIQNLLWF
jgi:hypothetical protein